jgi:hypothetical protein
MLRGIWMLGIRDRYQWMSDLRWPSESSCAYCNGWIYVSDPSKLNVDKGGLRLIVFQQLPVIFYVAIKKENRLCGLLVRVLAYRSRGPGFHSRRYHIFWELVGLERCPLSFMRIIEEPFQGNSSSGLANQINGRGKPLRWPRDTLYPQKLALTSPISGGRSVGIVRLRTTGHGILKKKVELSL